MNIHRPEKNSITRLVGFAAMILIVVFIASCAGPTSPTSRNESDPAAHIDAPRNLSVLTYNIHIGKSVDDKRIDLARIAKILSGPMPDIIGLQEVDRLTERSGRVDQLAELQSLTGMAGVFGKSIEFQGGEYGIAILTTGEILESRPILHPAGIEAERRSFLMARIRTRGGMVVWAINTHLGLNFEDRQAQVRAILDAAAGLEGPVIILGDLNEEPGEREGGLTDALDSAGFEDGWLMALEKVEVDFESSEPRAIESHGFTFPAEGPDRRIDYVWANRGSNLQPTRATIFHTLASDHVPLLLEYRVGE